MKALSEKVLGKLHFTLEQVQDLTPTPMTLSSVMFYTGINPYTQKPLFVARTQEEKRQQKSYFFRGERPAPNAKKSTETKNLLNDIKGLQKHHSIVKIGTSKPKYIEDKAFWELYKEIKLD